MIWYIKTTEIGPGTTIFGILVKNYRGSRSSRPNPGSESLRRDPRPAFSHISRPIFSTSFPHPEIICKNLSLRAHRPSQHLLLLLFIHTGMIARRNPPATQQHPCQIAHAFGAPVLRRGGGGEPQGRHLRDRDGLGGPWGAKGWLGRSHGAPIVCDMGLAWEGPGAPKVRQGIAWEGARGANSAAWDQR